MTKEKRAKIEAMLDDFVSKLNEGDNNLLAEVTGMEDKEHIPPLFRVTLSYAIAVMKMVAQIKQLSGINGQQKEITANAVIEMLDGKFLWNKAKPDFIHEIPELDELKEEGDVNAAMEAVFDEVIDKIKVSLNLSSKASKESEQATQKDATAPDMPKVAAKRAREIVSAVPKIADYVFNSTYAPKIFSEDGLQIRTAWKRRGVPIAALITTNHDELKEKGVDIPGWDNLDNFDREILTMSMSLYQTGYKYQTTHMIYQALSGNKDNFDKNDKRKKINITLTPSMKEHILQSLRKLSVIRIFINASQEYEAGKNIKAEFEDYLLPWRRATAEINGKETECIEVYGISPIFEYAAGKNQIARFDAKMLDVPINNTSENIALKGYLARRWASMKNEKSDMGNVIRYDTIYDYLHIDVRGYTKQGLIDKYKNIRNTVKTILQAWKEEGYIKDFQEKTDDGREPGPGKKAAKIIIEF